MRGGSFSFHRALVCRLLPMVTWFHGNGVHVIQNQGVFGLI